MKIEEEKTIGIVGGMGPQAGADLLSAIIRFTPAGRDQDHRNVILMSFPGQITDRTAYAEGEVEENPAYAITDILLKLEKAGAQVAGIACNSSHIPVIYDTICDQLRHCSASIKLLHMPEETCRLIIDCFPNVRKIGVLSTTGTFKAGIYPERLLRYGLTPVLPTDNLQRQLIHPIIYDAEHGIKSCPEKISDQVYEWLDEALDYFFQNGAEAIILGCTEFSLAIKDRVVKGMEVIDSNEALARALIRESAMRVNNEALKQIDLL